MIGSSFPKCGRSVGNIVCAQKLIIRISCVFSLESMYMMHEMYSYLLVNYGTPVRHANCKMLNANC